MSSLEVDLVTFSDADFNLTQAQPFANGLTTVGTNALHMQIRANATDPTVWIEVTTANGYITVSGGTSITIIIPQTLLAKMPAGAYVYSLIMSSNGGANRTEVMRGNVTHSAGPTQWTAGTV